MPMPRRGSLAIAALLLSAAAPLWSAIPNPPVLQWKGEFGGGGLTISSRVAVDSDGNFLQAGNRSTGARPVWVAKHTPVGVQEWVVDVAGAAPRSVSRLATDTNGDVVVAGGQGVHPSSDIFIFKVNRSGQVLWQTVISEAPSDRCLDLAIAPGGDVLLLGLCKSGTSDTSGDSALLLRLAGTTGNTRWGVKTSYSGTGGALTAFGNGDAAMALNIAGDIRVQRHLGSNGALVWKSSVDAGSTEIATDIAVDADGSLAIGGYTRPSPNRDWLTARLSTQGAVLWTRRLIGQGGQDDLIADVGLALHGRIYVSGYQILSPGYLESWLTPSVAVYSASGTLIYNFNAPNNNPEVFQTYRGFTVDQDGYAYLAIRDDVFGSDPIRTVAITPSGTLAWLAPYSETGVHIDPAGVAINSSNTLFVGATSFYSAESGGGVSSANVITLAYR